MMGPVRRVPGQPARAQASAQVSLPPVWLMALALVAVSANLRVAIASVPPLARTIAEDRGLSSTWIGALTTLPVLCMGLLAPAAQRLGARLGAAASVQISIIAVFAGVLLRWWGDHLWALYGGTLVAGFGIAVAGTLLPRLVKAVFPPERTGTITGLYMLAMMGGAAVAAALSVPLAARFGSWQASLASWSILAAFGAFAWAPVTAVISKSANPVAATTHRLPWRHPTAWLIAAYLVVQSWQFFSSLAWIAPSYVARGWDPTTAGYLLSAFSGAQLISGLLGPVLADKVHDHRTLLVPAASLALVGMLGLLLAPDTATAAWGSVCLLGLGQGAAFSLALVLLVEYAETPAGSGRLTAMTFFVSYTIASFGPTVMGALRDLTGSFQAIWMSMAFLTVVQVVLATRMKPGLAKVP